MTDHATPPSPSCDELIDSIDRGIESHLAWNHRLMRCSLLRETPSDEMLLPHSHQVCTLGRWLARIHPELERFDPILTRGIVQSHEAMHAAVRRLCERVLENRHAEMVDFDAYESSQSLMVARLHMLRQVIVEASMQHDALTGLPLRRGIEHAFRQRQAEAQRTASHFWLAMIDADRFKQINDTHGHAVGDRALQHLATRLSACLRQQDILFRFGGEEFLAMLIMPPRLGIENAAQRLLDTVRATPLPLEHGAGLALTVTIGLALVGSAESMPGAIDRADRALLRGKAAGRDRFVLATDTLADQRPPG